MKKNFLAILISLLLMVLMFPKNSQADISMVIGIFSRLATMPLPESNNNHEKTELEIFLDGIKKDFEAKGKNVQFINIYEVININKKSVVFTLRSFYKNKETLISLALIEKTSGEFTHVASIIWDDVAEYKVNSVTLSHLKNSFNTVDLGQIEEKTPATVPGPQNAGFSPNAN